MFVLEGIWEWIKAEVNAWVWIGVGLLFLLGMSALTDGIDWFTKKLWRIKD